MSTVTAERHEVRAWLRRRGDALPRASVGTVPILWRNTPAPAGASPLPAANILDEIARLGYEGTQSLDGFADGAALREALMQRDLRLAEVYVPLPATIDGPRPTGMDIAREQLRLLHDAGGDVLIVAIDGSPDRDRVAGRADAPDVPRFSDAGWDALIDVLHAIADEAGALGHAMAFHPHAATLIETPAEIDRLLDATDPARVGVCLDTGHHLVAGGDPVATSLALGDRLTHVHLKDVDRDVLHRLRNGDFAGMNDAVQDGLFTELGAGMLDLDGTLAVLAARDYAGWLMVEQDRSTGSPSDSAAIGRRVLAAALRRLGTTSTSDPA